MVAGAGSNPMNLMNGMQINRQDEWIAGAAPA